MGIWMPIPFKSQRLPLPPAVNKAQHAGRAVPIYEFTPQSVAVWPILNGLFDICTRQYETRVLNWRVIVGET